MSQFDLTDRVAVVTGGAGFLGRHFCKALAEAGADVIVVDRNLADAEMVAHELPGDPLAIGVNLANENEIVAMRDKAVGHYGRLDILHNNAATLAFDVVTGANGQPACSVSVTPTLYPLINPALKAMCVPVKLFGTAPLDQPGQGRHMIAQIRQRRQPPGQRRDRNGHASPSHRSISRARSASLAACHTSAAQDN